MKTRISLVLFFFIALQVVLSACTPVPGVFDVQVEPETQPTSIQAKEGSVTAEGMSTEEIIVTEDPLADLKPIALAMLGGSITDLMPYVQYITVACTTADGLGGPPKCTEGEADGTEVTVFPSGGSEGSYLRPEEMEEYLAFNLTLKGLYAVYQVTPKAEVEPYWPEGEYALLLEREVNDFPIPITALVQDGKLVRLNFEVGTAPADIIQGLPVADILVPPQEVEEWLDLPDSLIPTRPEDTVSEPGQEETSVPSETELVITSTRTASTTPGWVLYTVPALGYSFEIPDSWIVDDSQLNEPFHSVIVSPPNADPNLIYLYVIVDPRGMEEVEAVYQSSFGQFAPYVFAGQNGFQVNHTDYPRIEYLIPYQDTVIILNTDVIEWPEIQQMLASFTLHP